MKKSFLQLSVLLLILSTLSGCLWVERDGYGHGDFYRGDNGKNHGKNKH